MYSYAFIMSASVFLDEWIMKMYLCGKRVVEDIYIGCGEIFYPQFDLLSIGMLFKINADLITKFNTFMALFNLWLLNNLFIVL